ncbi:MAG: hypothetical protein ACRCUB_09670 [Plesiomonas shigelloides]
MSISEQNNADLTNIMNRLSVLNERLRGPVPQGKDGLAEATCSNGVLNDHLGQVETASHRIGEILSELTDLESLFD